MSKGTSPLSGGRGLFESFWHRKTSHTAGKPNGSEYTETSVGSHLFRWLVQLKDTVISKFTFFYYKELSSQAASLETMRSMYDENIAKLQNKIDFVYKVELFQKQILCTQKCKFLSCHFYLICESDLEFVNGTEDQVSQPSVDNLNKQSHTAHHLLFSSSCMVSYDSAASEEYKKEKTFESSLYFGPSDVPEKQRRMMYLGIISSQLQEEMTWTHLSRPNQIVHFDCKFTEAKYFLLRIEPQVVLSFIISFETDTNETTTDQSHSCSFSRCMNHIDLEAVSQFMHEIAVDTRLNNRFASLKSVFINI
jgi:hypothetical protein